MLYTLDNKPYLLKTVNLRKTVVIAVAGIATPSIYMLSEGQTIPPNIIPTWVQFADYKNPYIPVSMSTIIATSATPPVVNVNFTTPLICAFNSVTITPNAFVTPINAGYAGKIANNVRWNNSSLLPVQPPSVTRKQFAGEIVCPMVDYICFESKDFVSDTQTLLFPTDSIAFYKNFLLRSSVSPSTFQSVGGFEYSLVAGTYQYLTTYSYFELV
jgi:hypothetical protein